MSDTSPDPRRLNGPVASVVTGILTRVIRSQAGAARSYVQKLRESNPDESPAQIRERLDNRFLTLVTATGTAAGASAAVPGIGTMVGLGAIGAESLAFVEATAFYSLAVAEVHGVDVSDPEQEKTLVMSVLLGASGTAILSKAVGDAGGDTKGPLAGGALGMPSLAVVNNRLINSFINRYIRRKAMLSVGKLAPAGVGAAVGAWGNRKLGRSVIDTAHATYGAPPTSWTTA